MKVAHGRARSNSRSSGSRSVIDLEQENLMFPQDQQPPAVAPIVAVHPRNRYTHIIVLKSLNATFETKFLVVPFKPDILKLGRPVANTGGNANGKGNSAGGASSVVRSDNGNFDSRVLSRNHACLSCDAESGEILIHDLNSSNGTFVNGIRISNDDVELNIGDVIDLGTDIDNKFEHRKISAFVEDISVIPLINTESTTSNSGGSSNNVNFSPKNPGQSSSEVQDNAPLTAGNQSFNGNASMGEINLATTAQRAAFEAAMFGDVNNLDLEDSVLGVETEVLSGIFMNNSVGTSSNLINIIKTLSTEISLERKELNKLQSMTNFLINYSTNIGKITQGMKDLHEKQLNKLQGSLRKTLAEKHEILLQDCKDQISKIEAEKNNLEAALNKKKEQNDEHISKLKMQLNELKASFENEKSKNMELSKNISIKKDKKYKKLARDSSGEKEAPVDKSTNPPILKLNKTQKTIATATVAAIIAIVIKYKS